MKIRSEYIEALKFIIIGLVACLLTGVYVASGQDVELGRRLPSAHMIFLCGFLSVLWGLFKLFMGLIALDNEEDR